MSVSGAMILGAESDADADRPAAPFGISPSAQAERSERGKMGAETLFLNFGFLSHLNILYYIYIIIL